METYSKSIEEHLKVCKKVATNMEIEEMKNEDIYINCNIYNQAEGSSIVHLKNTIVTCGLKVKAHLDLNTIHHTNLNKGILVCNVELTPLCSKNIQPGLPGEESQFLTEQMTNFLSNYGPDLNKLVILENKAVYVLYFDFIVLNHAGNLLDACILAANSVIRSAKFPKVVWNSEKQALEFPITQDVMSIARKDLVYSITYGLKGNNIFLNIEENVETYLNDDFVNVIFFISESGKYKMPIINGCLNDNKRSLLANLIPSVIDRMKFLNDIVSNACK